jgi:biotin-(acetyl-CoA carboxylase) ligase|tara:strand:+ start:687 stop:911 length:225 start_codon:yes stop_codon:yes gene_type:complete
MKRDKIMRVSKEFDKRLRNLANAKIKNGTAKLQRRETFSTRRLTLALTRHQDIDKIMKDIEKAEWEGDKPSKWK